MQIGLVTVIAANGDTGAGAPNWGRTAQSGTNVTPKSKVKIAAGGVASQAIAQLHTEL